MSFMDEVLVSSETLRYDIPVIPLIVYVPLGLAGAAFFVSVVSYFMSWKITLACALVFAGFFAVLALHAALLRLSNKQAITDKRVVARTGIISRDFVEINLDKIESVEIQQGPIGLLLGFGHLYIRGTGAEEVAMRFVAHPVDMRKALLEGATH